MKNKLLFYALLIAASVSIVFGAAVVVSADETEDKTVVMQNSMMQMMNSMKDMMSDMNEHCSKMMDMGNMMSHHKSHHGGD